MGTGRDAGTLQYRSYFDPAPLPQGELAGTDTACGWRALSPGLLVFHRWRLSFFVYFTGGVFLSVFLSFRGGVFPSFFISQVVSFLLSSGFSWVVWGEDGEEEEVGSS